MNGRMNLDRHTRTHARRTHARTQCCRPFYTINYTLGKLVLYTTDIAINMRPFSSRPSSALHTRSHSPSPLEPRWRLESTYTHFAWHTQCTRATEIEVSITSRHTPDGDTDVKCHGASALSSIHSHTGALGSLCHGSKRVPSILYLPSAYVINSTLQIDKFIRSIWVRHNAI